MNSNINNTSNNNNRSPQEYVSEQLWENLQLNSSEDSIQEFARAIFSTASYKNISNYQVSNSGLLQYFFGISVPLSERITNIIRGTREDQFIEEYQFVDLVTLLYKGSIRSKIIFFFKLFDYQDNKILKKVNVITLFYHIHHSALELINELFGNKEEITFKEFLLKQKENMDLVLFFYFYLHQQRRINDKIIKVYNTIIKDETNTPKNKIDFYPNKNKSRTIDNKHAVCINTSNEVVNMSPLCQKREYHNIKTLKTLEKKRKMSFIGNLQAQEKEIKRQKTGNLKKSVNILIKHSQSPEILNTELIPKNTKKFFYVIKQTFGIDVSNGMFPDMPKLNPQRKEQSSVSLHGDNFDDLTELDAFENDIHLSLSKTTIISHNTFHFFKPPKYYSNDISNDINLLKHNCENTSIKSHNTKHTLEIFKPKCTKSFQYFEETSNTQQTNITISNSSINKNKTHSFHEFNHSIIVPNEDFISQYPPNELSNTFLNNNISNIDELNFIMKYSVYDYQFHFGMLFLIGNFIFFICGKKKEQGQNKVYTLLIDKSFIKTEDKELIQIIMPFGDGQFYTFRFNSQIKKNEFLLNIGYSQKFFDNYKLVKEIGKGKFGVVWEGSKGKNTYAIKVFNKRGRFKLCRREAYISSFISKHKHKHLIDIEEVYENGDTVYVVMEYIRNGVVNEHNIHNVLKQYKDPVIAGEMFIMQIIEVIDFLHQYGIVHRDLKIDNVLINDASSLHLKLIDFGLSTIINSDETIYEKCGTLVYTAPEILNKTKYNRNIDLWSIGIIAYFLHFKQFPFMIFTLKEINMALNNLNEIVNAISISELKDNFVLHVMKSCLIKSHILRKKCSVLLENYTQYINNKTHN